MAEYWSPDRPERKYGRPLDPRTDYSGHMSATLPTLRQRVARGLSPGNDKLEAGIEGALTFDPFTTAHGAGQAFGESRYGDAALDALSSAPGVGKIGGLAAGAGIKGAMFLGPMARSWYKPAERHAMEMLQNGASRDQILRSTGLFQGKDGIWRKEISDAPARYLGFGRGSERPMAKIIEHPELYENYPQLAKLPVERIHAPGNIGGGISNARPQGLGKMFINVLANRNSAAERLSTALHEGQHGIQQLEGFAGGASNQVPPFGIAPTHDAYPLYQKYLQQTQTDPMFVQELAKHKIPQQDWPDRLNRWAEQQAMNEWYNRVAGEVESRNTQYRAGMTMEDRMKIPPWNTEEIVPSQQFINPATTRVDPPRLPPDPLRGNPQLPFRPKLPRMRP